MYPDRTERTSNESLQRTRDKRSTFLAKVVARAAELCVSC
jgi:hypothetical protein